MTEEDETQKAKQARIRDNQRRSRARRQEHLADLEKRLAECHTICREAALQRDAFNQLQGENLRLRELLELAGVNSGLVEVYVHRGTLQEDNKSSNLRQIRPKFTNETMTSQQFVKDENSTATRASSPASTMPASEPPLAWDDAAALVQSPNVKFSVTRRSQGLSTVTEAPSPVFINNGALSGTETDSSWDSHVETDSIFCCGTFQVPPNGTLQRSSENTVPCSVAKDMILQYNIDDRDFDEIKIRLADGFAKDRNPGECCRVKTQILFAVLNDISSRLS